MSPAHRSRLPRIVGGATLVALLGTGTGCTAGTDSPAERTPTSTAATTAPTVAPAPGTTTAAGPTTTADATTTTSPDPTTTTVTPPPAPRARWADYFGPTAVGASCTRSSSGPLSDLAGGQIRQTVEVTDAVDDADGRRVTLRVTTGDDVVDLAYRLRADGALEAPLQQTESVTLLEPLVLPALDDGSAPVERSAAARVMVAGQARTVRMWYRVDRLRSVPVTAPAGTFLDVVGFRIVITNMAYDDPALNSPEVTAALRSIGLLFGTTTWFGRHAGPVSTTTGSEVVGLVGCEGPGTEEVLAATGAVPPEPALTDEQCIALANALTEGRANDAAALPSALAVWAQLVATTSGDLQLDARAVQAFLEEAAPALARGEDPIALLATSRTFSEAGEATRRLQARSASACTRA